MGISISGDEVVGGTLTITVRDGSTAVSGAEVRILYWSNGMLNAINLGNTNSDGEVEFTPTFAGEYRVEATESGYGSVELGFTVEEAEEAPVVGEEEAAAGTEPAGEQTGTGTSGGETSGSTGGQPVGTETPVETTPECIVDTDCGAGFGCEGGACVETAGQPAAEGEESPAPGTGNRMPETGNGVPWWAWLIILIVLGAGAYWYFGMRKK
jgi:LPXTG-motif cell wall-anchored protein